MTQLFKQRLAKHVIQMTKYLKYVFNDFFVLALIFILGGLGLAYSNFLKSLTPGNGWVSLAIALVILVALQMGHLATLIQSPDYVFLLPRDRSMRQYLKPALGYSLLNAGIVQIVVWFLLLPLFKIQFRASGVTLLVWLLIMLFLKADMMGAAAARAFRERDWFNIGVVNRWLMPIFFVGIGEWQPLPSLLGLLLWTLVRFGLNRRRLTAGSIDWNRLIKAENDRMHRIYQVFNMFVDVPQIKGTVKRRSYLTPLFKLIKPTSENAYLYLYLRSFVRDREFSNLYLRLTFIGMVLLWFLKGIWLPVIIGAIFIYLIGFQLIPFYFHFDDNAFIYIYPLASRDPLVAFQKVIGGSLLMTGMLFTVILILSHGGPDGGVELLVSCFEGYVLTRFYVPRRIRRAQKQ